VRARSLMTINPKIVASEMPAIDALLSMEKLSITSLLIVNADGKPIGVLHLHDLLKAGLM
jgi:arabinose-5-phosphate isomerase